MRLLSVNTGRVREVEFQGERVGTGIFKAPTDGPVGVTHLTLEGDHQVDLRFHGGPDKAVYTYPAEHYAHWSADLDRGDLLHGQFGENFTTTGLLETEVCIGDQLGIGTARFEVTQPRVPCFKLGIRMGDPRFIKRFHLSRRVGFYLRVLEEGSVCAGDAIALLARAQDSITIDAIYRLHFEANPDRAALQRAVGLSSLSQSWREELGELLKRNS